MKQALFLLFIFIAHLSYGQTKAVIDPYELAVDEISEMLSGQRPMNFKRAVFLTENAYYDNKLDWTTFCKEIDQAKVKINQMIVAKKLQQYKTAGNWAIFSYMTDSIPENSHRPYQYDMDNFMNEKYMDCYMVSSLLKTKKGNCHSLPYLYKILANEVNVESYISLAPMHVFIKHKDEHGQWWNLELTSGSFSRTSFIIESFNVSDAGMQSGLYLKPLSEKESVALCLSDLLDYYDRQKGIYYGDLVRKAYTAGINIYPNSLLQIAKRDEIKYRLDNEMKAKGLNDYNKILPYPDLVKLYSELNETTDYLKKIGYVRLSEQAYKQKVEEMRNFKNAQAKK